MTHNMRSTPAASTHSSMENQEGPSAKSELVSPNAQPLRNAQPSPNRLAKAKLLGAELPAAQPKSIQRKALRDDEATSDTNSLSPTASDSLRLTNQETAAATTDTSSDLLQDAKAESNNTDDERLQAQQVETTPLIPTSTVAAWQVADNSPGLPEGLTAASPPSAPPSPVMGGWALGTPGIVAGGALAAAALGGSSHSSGPDTTAPVLQSVSARVLDNIITLTYDSALNAQHAPLASAFAISQGGVTLTVQSVQISGSTLTLTLSNSHPLQSGGYTITYNEPAVTDTQATQDLSGNHSASLNLVLDPLAPTITLSSDKSLLGEGQTSTITLTASESLRSLKLSDLSVTGGTLQNLQAGVDGHSYSATLTPNANLPLSSTMSVSLATGAVTDFSGATNAASNTLAINVDKTPPQLLSVSGSAASDTVELRFDVPLDANHLPQLSQFTIAQGSQVLALESVSLIGSGYVLSLKVHGDLMANPFSVRYQDASTGNDALAIQNTLGNDVGNFEQGLVADGPIKGAHIYIDANRNGVADASEDTGVITDQYGRYILTNATQSGPIIAVGGVNTDTGIANTMALQAPEGSMVINPITSLVQSLALQKGLTTAQASSQIASALGLPPELDLSRFDPLGVVGDVGLAGQKIAAQIATLAHTIASAGGAASGTSVIADLALSLSDAPTPSTGTSVLDQAPLLQTLMHKAQVPDGQQSALLGELQQAIQDIHAATNISGISSVQSTALDNVTPATPTIKMVMPTALGEAPQVVVAFNTDSTNGSAATVGDVLTVTVGTTSYTHTLTLSDIVKGETSVAVAMDTQMLDATATLTDRAGHMSAVAAAPIAGSDTIDMANYFGQPIQLMLQTMGNQEFPLIGSMEDFTQQIWLAIKDGLFQIPTAHLKSAAPAPTPMSGLSIEDLTGDTPPPPPTIEFEPTTPTNTSSNGDNSDLPPWMRPETADTSNGTTGQDTSGGGTSGGGTSGEGSSGGGSNDNGTSGSTPARVLVGRNTGQQYEIPTWEDFKANFWPQSFTQDPKTGEFKFNFKLPFRIKQWDMLGSAGGDGAAAKIDASFDSYAQVEVNLEGLISADKYMVLDTTKSKVELSFDAGLKEGSQFAAQLGPLVVAATDMVSARAPADNRKDTGISGTVDVYLKDNDGTDNKKLTLNSDTISKLIKQISDGTYKVSDWNDLSVNISGGLSAQILTRLDFNGIPSVVDALQSKDLTLAQLSKALGLPDSVGAVASSMDSLAVQIDSMTRMLSPQISTKFYMPLGVKYDSRTPDIGLQTTYDTIYFDDIKVGAQTILHDTIGPGLDLLDKVMAPMYAVEDFMSTALPWPDTTTWLPPNTSADFSSWPELVKSAINGVTSLPVNVVKTMVNDLQTAMDQNGDHKITLFEALRGSVNTYHATALKVAEFWNQLKSLPGIDDALKAASKAIATSTGTGADPYAVLTAIMEVIDSSVRRPPATADNPNPLSPMEQIQKGLDVAEQTLNAIAQLQSLRGAYEQAMNNPAMLEGESSLSFNIGSYAWNISQNSLSEVLNKYDKSGIDYSLPTSSAEVLKMTREEAISLIYTQVKAGTASSKTLSPDVFAKAGVDFSKLTLTDQYAMFNRSYDWIMGSYGKKLKPLDFTTGVNAFNIDAICQSLINQKDKIFGAGTPDWSSNDVLTSKTSLDFTKQLDVIVHYNRLERIALGLGDFAGWLPDSMADSFYKLGAVQATDYDLKQVSVSPILNSPYYGGFATSYILSDIVKNLEKGQVDSLSELKALWKVLTKIEDLMGHLTVNPKFWEKEQITDSARLDQVLTFDDYKLIGLEILSHENAMLSAMNTMVYKFAKGNNFRTLASGVTKYRDFDALYDDLKTYVENANTQFKTNSGTNGNSLAQHSLELIMQLADDNGTGDSSKLSIETFKNMGVMNMNKDWIKMAADFLTSSAIKSSDVNSVYKVQAFVDDLKILMDTADDKTVDATKFYDAMDLLLGNIPYSVNSKYYSRAEILAHLPLANAGGIDEINDPKALPLLQDIVKHLSAQEVDSFAEMDKLASISQDILFTTMIDPKVWKVHGLWRPAGNNEASDNVYLKYTPHLTADDLGLLGFRNINDVSLEAVKSALKTFNQTDSTYTFKDYTSWLSSNSTVTTIKPMDWSAIEGLISQETDAGLFQETLAKLGWLDGWNAFRDAGFNVPILSDPAALIKLWLGNPVDLLTFNPDLSKLSLDTGTLSLFNVDLLQAAGYPAPDKALFPLSMPLDVSASLKIEPRLSFGVDTGGLMESWKLPSDAGALDKVKALLNSVYMNDYYWVSGQMKDLPELAINMDLFASLGGQIGAPGFILDALAQIKGGFDFQAAIDLNSTSSDGKVRMADMIGGLFTDPLGVLNMTSTLDFSMQALAKASLDLTPSNWGNLNQTARDVVYWLGKGAELLTGQTSFVWAPEPVGTTFTLIDDNPATSAPSLMDLVHKVI